MDVLEDKTSNSPLGILHHRDIKDLIARELSRPEKMILILYYYEEMTMKEIGDALELSESRISQMHSSLIARLRSQLAIRGKEFSADQTPKQTHPQPAAFHSTPHSDKHISRVIPKLKCP